MSDRMIQIRNVPSNIHRALKVRAAVAGKSMSDYILGELRRNLERPPREELLARVAQRARTELRTGAAQALREERDSR